MWKESLLSSVYIFFSYFKYFSLVGRYMNEEVILELDFLDLVILVDIIYIRNKVFS